MCITGAFAQQLARLSPRLRRFHALVFLAVYLPLVVVVFVVVVMADAWR